MGGGLGLLNHRNWRAPDIHPSSIRQQQTIISCLTPWLLRYNSEWRGQTYYQTFSVIALLLIGHIKVQPIVTLFHPPTHCRRYVCSCSAAGESADTELCSCSTWPWPPAPAPWLQGALKGEGPVLLHHTNTTAPQKLFNGFPDNSSFTPSTGPMEIMNKIITFWQKLKRFSFHNANLDEISQFSKLF